MQITDIDFYCLLPAEPGGICMNEWLIAEKHHNLLYINFSVKTRLIFLRPRIQQERIDVKHNIT